MSDARGDAAAIFKSDKKLTAQLRKCAEDVLKEALPGPPLVTISGRSDRKEEQVQGSARTVLIRQKTYHPEDSPAGTLVLWVNDRAIDPRHAELVLDGRTWLLTNIGDAPITMLKDKRVAAEVRPGESHLLEGQDFQFRIRSWEFSFQAQPEPFALEVGPTAAAIEGEPARTWFSALGCPFELRSPEKFWETRQGPEAVLDAIWERVAAALEVRQAGMLEFVANARGAAGAAAEAHRVSAVLSGNAIGFELSVPVAFYEALLSRLPRAASPHAEKLRGEIRWQRWLILGEQELLLSQLAGLGPDKVLVLRQDSAGMLDQELNQEWKLTRLSPKPGPQEKVAFRIGEARPRMLRNGGHVAQSGAAMDTANLPVRVQAVLTIKDIAVKELQDYAPGKDLPLDLTERREVELAINGRILGKGKLVKLPDGRMGVQVVNWNV